MNKLIESIQKVTVEFATDFATAIVAAIVDSNFRDLLEANGASTSPRAHATSAAPRKAKVPSKSKPGKSGRMARRSPEQIAEAVASIQSLLKKHPDGLRAEQIREELGLDKRELPRLLQNGVGDGAFKVLHGVKRSTTYGIKGGKTKKTVAAAAPKRKAPKKAKKTAVKKPKKAKKAKKTVKVGHGQRVGQNGAATVAPASA